MVFMLEITFFLCWWTILSFTLRISLWTWCTNFFSRFNWIPHFSTDFFFRNYHHHTLILFLWAKLRLFSTGLCFTFCLLFWFPCRNLLHLNLFWFFSNPLHSILLWIYFICTGLCFLQCIQWYNFTFGEYGTWIFFCNNKYLLRPEEHAGWHRFCPSSKKAPFPILLHSMPAQTCKAHKETLF